MKTIESTVRELVQLLGADINKIEATEADGIMTVVLDTDINAYLVGKDGEHLRALLSIAREITAKQGLESTFRIDIGGFEADQKKKHEVTARMYAERARHVGGVIDVPPSDPFARRIMHAYIQSNYPELVTESEGAGRERHLVIRKK